MINHATSPKLYRSCYPHRSRDSLSPVCGIFYLEYPNLMPFDLNWVKQWSLKHSIITWATSGPRQLVGGRRHKWWWVFPGVCLTTLLAQVTATLWSAAVVRLCGQTVWSDFSCSTRSLLIPGIWLVVSMTLRKYFSHTNDFFYFSITNIPATWIFPEICSD